MERFGLASQFPLVSDERCNPSGGKPAYQSRELEWRANTLVTPTKDIDGGVWYLYFPVSVEHLNGQIRLSKGPDIYTGGILMTRNNQCYRVTASQLRRGRIRIPPKDFDFLAADVRQEFPEVIPEPPFVEWVSDLPIEMYTLTPETYWRDHEATL